MVGLNKSLPEWCRILDELISEITEERAGLCLDNKDGVDGAANTASTPTTDAVNTLPRKEVITVE